MNFDSVKAFVFDKRSRFSILASHGYYNKLSDEEFIKREYKLMTGKELNLDAPKTFNEKIQWLKLYDKKPVYTKMVDKYEVKQYVADVIGREYIIPSFGVWNHFDEIDFNKLPNQFVLKCTHDSGGLEIVRDKNEMNVNAIRKKIEKCLRRNYYNTGREWPYKDVKPRIIAEKYMEDEESSGKSLHVYKFFCFHGKPYIIQAIQDDKMESESIDYFNTDWDLLTLRQNFPNSKCHLERPKHLDEMISVAKSLSRDNSFLRVDLYDTKDGVFFSEFTFYSDNGTALFEPEEWDITLGEMIKLNK